MKRTLTFSLLLCVLALSSFSSISDAQRRRGRGGRTAPPATGGKVTIPCPATLNDITDCLDTGCGDLDPLLNTQKNTTKGNPDSASGIEFSELAGLPKLVSGYKGIGFPRNPLNKIAGTNLGEGKMVRLVAWALDSRPQKTQGKNKDGTPKRGESCNCGFTGIDDPQNTDVHIVLVDDAALKLKATAANGKSAASNTLKLREAESQTAEFAPRLRIARNERFDGAKLKGLIDSANGELLVRVTGLIMYDSEHAVGPFKLLRHTDWEIHPVFRLEYCPNGETCAAGSNANWKNLEQ